MSKCTIHLLPSQRLCFYNLREKQTKFTYILLKFFALTRNYQFNGGINTSRADNTFFMHPYFSVILEDTAGERPENQNIHNDKHICRMGKYLCVRMDMFSSLPSLFPHVAVDVLSVS